MSVFGLVALICFILALFIPEIGDLSLITLGFVFIAAHMVFGPIWSTPPWRRT